MEMEKFITLALIDQAWKEHLREMDDLKQSVQNAVYEQKDPLLIYKFEAFELFKQFLAKVNEDIVTFLMRAEIPVQDESEVREAEQRKIRERYNEQKEESRSLLSNRGGGRTDRPPVQKAPAKSEKIHGRNDRVTVQYQDGKVMKDVKFKKVEDDVKNNRCVIIEE
jgi:preprotein translocase subunit SecA